MFYPKNKKKALEGTEGGKIYFAEPITGGKYIDIVASERSWQVWS
jgi:Cu(I)/Ag(I) efflux system membrane protein CusA/SilA